MLPNFQGLLRLAIILAGEQVKHVLVVYLHVANNGMYIL